MYACVYVNITTKNLVRLEVGHIYIHTYVCTHTYVHTALRTKSQEADRFTGICIYTNIYTINLNMPCHVRDTRVQTCKHNLFG